MPFIDVFGKIQRCFHTEWQIKWNITNSLPSLNKDRENKGVAGAFPGFIDDDLIIAGGYFSKDTYSNRTQS